MSVLVRSVVFACYCAFAPLVLLAEDGGRRQDCEQLTEIALGKLLSLVQKNDYAELETVLATIQSGCGESEFTQRMRIFRALLEKKPTAELITDYLAKNYHEALITRWDRSAEEQYESIYRSNKPDFGYVPLRHPIDSLLKAKAEALLHSTAFSLSEREGEIALLFADRLEEFYEMHERSSRPQKPTRTKAAYRRGVDKYHAGLSIYAGAEFPVASAAPFFRTSPVMGFMYSSPLEDEVLFELGLKIRLNFSDGNRRFEYRLDDDTESVSSGASYGVGGTLGRKLFDNDALIIYPKLGLFFETTSTGLSHFGDYDDEYEVFRMVYNNVNTMRTSLGLAFMWHVSGKRYAGFEVAYHHIPYNWDSHLLTRIQPNYASAQLFFRF